MASSPEFASLLESAADLGIPHDPSVRYVSRQTVLRGMRFHFTEWGEPGAPPVLLLHGGNQSSHSWDLVSLHLSDRYHVYALDQRGHGDTEWSRELDYSMEAMAADVLAFIADQGIERPIIFGHSMGGRVTLQRAARARPTLARALVLVDVGPELSPKGAKVDRRLRRPQHRVRRPRRVPRQRRDATTRSARASTSPARSSTTCSAGRRQVRQQGRPPPAAGADRTSSRSTT